MQRGLEQIRATVRALLVEARLDSPALTESDWSDLKELVQPQAAQSRIRLNGAIAASPVLPLPAHQVRQLVLNLLLNATKACSQDGIVSLDVNEREGKLMIEVTNTGESLDTEHTSSAFSNPSFRSRSEGLGRLSHGLGLWVSYQIAQQLGGSITAGSEQGVTRFSVDLASGTRHNRQRTADMKRHRTLSDRRRPDHGRIAL